MEEEVLQILYQDDRYVAVHKPAGLLVHRTAIDRYETRFCLQILRGQLNRHVYPCHRLDKPTSGVLLFALDKDALKAVTGLFEEKHVRKTYHAIVRGWVEGEGRIDHPLRYFPDGGEERGAGQPQPAVSNWCSLKHYEIMEPVGRYPTARYSLVKLVPETGRRHQLRRHMKHLNHHIIGDTRYGDGVHNRFFRECLNSHRLMLIASQMEFAHPFTAEHLVIEAGQDEDFQIVLENPILKEV